MDTCIDLAKTGAPHQTKSLAKNAKGSLREPKGRPKGAQRQPKGAKREAKGSPGGGNTGPKTLENQGLCCFGRRKVGLQTSFGGFWAPFLLNFGSQIRRLFVLFVGFVF